jgi:hypothetical protein
VKTAHVYSQRFLAIYLCRPVDRYQRFGGTFCLHLQGVLTLHGLTRRWRQPAPIYLYIFCISTQKTTPLWETQVLQVYHAHIWSWVLYYAVYCNCDLLFHLWWWIEIIMSSLHILYFRGPFPKIGNKNKNKKIQSNCSVFSQREMWWADRHCFPRDFSLWLKMPLDLRWFMITVYFNQHVSNSNHLSTLMVINDAPPPC